MSDVIVGLWQQGQLAEMTAPYKNEKPYTGTLSSLQAAVKSAEKTVPDMKVSIVAYQVLCLPANTTMPYL
jgi:hypothetical protein